MHIIYLDAKLLACQTEHKLWARFQSQKKIPVIILHEPCVRNSACNYNHIKPH